MNMKEDSLKDKLAISKELKAQLQEELNSKLEALTKAAELERKYQGELAAIDSAIAGHHEDTATELAEYLMNGTEVEFNPPSELTSQYSDAEHHLKVVRKTKDLFQAEVKNIQTQYNEASAEVFRLATELLKIEGAGIVAKISLLEGQLYALRTKLKGLGGAEFALIKYSPIKSKTTLLSYEGITALQPRPEPQFATSADPATVACNEWEALFLELVA
jgi:DNA repair exonuclease SbcCD ATPase subunit